MPPDTDPQVVMHRQTRAPHGNEGVFMVSFDCEGKWGFADRMTVNHEKSFTTDRLVEAYRKLLQLLKKKDIGGTFAFVGAFALPRSAYREHTDWFVAETANGQDWMAAFKADARQGRYEGWFAPEVLQLVMEDGRHEIGSHGFSHIPLGNADINAATFHREMELSSRVGAFYGYKPRTLIYPRNIIGYTDELRRHGLSGYRGGKHPSLYRKVANRASEFNIMQSSEPLMAPSGTSPVRIPGSGLLNWRSGMRKHIPMSVTQRRWEHALEHAATVGGAVHIWTHPHNFITGSRQFELLEGILDVAQEYIQSGRLRNPNQQEYADLFTADEDVFDTLERSC